MCELEKEMQQMYIYLYYEIDNTEMVQVQQKLLLYYCFTIALLLLYYCFTTDNTEMVQVQQKPLLYHCFTTA